MVTDDLAAWLTRIWDEDTKRNRGHEEDCADWLQGPCDCFYGEIRAHIAADRQILVLHSGDNDEPCQSAAGNYVYEPCQTVRLQAQPYVGRPGYREEWRPDSPDQPGV